jgi:2-methylcitrate dehydratase PrpD
MTESRSSSDATKILAEYTASLDFRDLPEPVAAQAKIVLLDTLASMLAASGPEFAASRLVQGFVRDAGGTPHASVAGLSDRLPAMHAAFANGTMADNIEMDDSHPRTGAHIAAAVVPAALAVAEWKRRSGTKLMESIVAAYDVEARAILAANASSMYSRGFHPSAVFGAFGAATAASKALALDAAKTAHALGLAGCQASGLMAWEADPTQMPKSLQLGIAARNGVTAAILAEAGFVGPPAIFEGRYNATEAFSDQATMAPLTEELGSRYEITLTGLKRYPMCRFLHASLDAFFEIQQTEKPSPSEIEQITIRMPHAGVPIVDNNELRSHSAQYVLSLAAVRGALQVADVYRDERDDPAIASMMNRVQVVGDARLDADAAGRFSEPAVVEVRMKDGRLHTARADAAGGDPEKPLSWDDVVQKFQRLATPVAGTGRAAEIIALVENLDGLAEISALCALLRA